MSIHMHEAAQSHLPAHLRSLAVCLYCREYKLEILPKFVPCICSSMYGEIMQLLDSFARFSQRTPSALLLHLLHARVCW